LEELELLAEAEDFALPVLGLGGTGRWNVRGRVRVSVRGVHLLGEMYLAFPVEERWG
jgi:hypothetical protein